MTRSEANKVIRARNKLKREIKKTEDAMWKGSIKDMTLLKDKLNSLQSSLDEGHSDFIKAFKFFMSPSK